VSLATVGAVAAGGALGSVLRYAVSAGMQQWLGRSFPFGTLFVNFLGSCAIGLLFVWFVERAGFGDVWRLFWMVGVLGGFTTFSAFSLDAFVLVQEGRAGSAALYVMLSLILCLGGTAIGVLVARVVNQ